MVADFFCPECGAANPTENAVCSFCSYARTPSSSAHAKNHDTLSLRSVSQFFARSGSASVRFRWARLWSDSHAPHVPKAVPRRLKQRYQILAKLGQGGFGTVYKAQDLQLASAFRAVKEMDDARLSPQEKQETITGFQQEAHILAHLMHPNLPRIYDYFEEKQRWYLVMDYIDGETLEQVLVRAPQGKLPEEQIIRYALQLCAVLHYLHTQASPIIFRDLKPANIMITPNDHLYLIDFGIARFFKAGKGKDTLALGSPGYAAPEQFGRAQTTAQADIYSLGATLHHLLSGRDPSDEPFVFPPLQLESPHPMKKALADLVARMVAIKKEERPASILEIQQVLLAIRP